MSIEKLADKLITNSDSVWEDADRSTLEEMGEDVLLKLLDEKKKPKDWERFEKTDGSLFFETAERTIVPVTIRDKDTKKLQSYTLRELSGKDRDKYLNVMGGKMRHREGEKGLKNFDNITATLIHLSLLYSVIPETLPEGTKKSDWLEHETNAVGTNVPTNLIQTWPSTLQKGMHAKCVDMSSLDEGDEEDSKND